MRRNLLLAALGLVALGLAAPQPAEAFDRRYRENFVVGSPNDPYSYQYIPPRYYPYYNSGMWRPTEEMRYRYRYDFVRPPYFEAWGWNSREWYLKHRRDRHAHWRR